MRKLDDGLKTEQKLVLNVPAFYNSQRVTVLSLKSVFFNLSRVVHFTLHRYRCVVKFHCFATDCQRRAQKLQ